MRRLQGLYAHEQRLDHWAQRRVGSVPPELMGRIAPPRTESINLRGIFRFPVERYVDKILPSVAAKTTTADRAREAKTESGFRS